MMYSITTIFDFFILDFMCNTTKSSFGYLGFESYCRTTFAKYKATQPIALYAGLFGRGEVPCVTSSCTWKYDYTARDGGKVLTT